MYRIALEVARRKWLTAVPSREEKKLVSGRQERSLLALYTLFCLSSMDCIHVLIFLTEKKLAIWLLWLLPGALLMFLRSEVQNRSHWATVKVSAGPILFGISREGSSSLLFASFKRLPGGIWPCHSDLCIHGHISSLTQTPPDSLWQGPLWLPGEAGRLVDSGD